MWRESKKKQSGMFDTVYQAAGHRSWSHWEVHRGAGRQLFAYTLGNRVKTGGGASGENYSFHKFTLFIYALSAALDIVKASFTLLSLAR